MKPPPPAEILGLVAGFGVWASAFSILYGLHGGACEAVWFRSEGQLRAALIAVLGIHIAAHITICTWFIRRLRTAPSDLVFLRTASLVLAISALGTTIWTAAPVLVLKTCW